MPKHRTGRVTRFVALVWVMGLILASLAGAAEVQVFSANGVKMIVAEIAPRFEKAAGHKLAVTLGEAGELRHRIVSGEAFDLAFLPAATLADLEKDGKIAPGTSVAIASSDVGMAVRVGAAKPDTSSIDAFRSSLLAARSIVITDPESGGVSGVHIAAVLQRLGIADQVKPKLTLTRGASNAALVARGEAELAVQLAHEIHAVPGVEFVALPAEFQRSITFSAGIGGSAREPGASKELIDYLAGPGAAPTIREAGMQSAAGK